MNNGDQPVSIGQEVMSPTEPQMVQVGGPVDVNRLMKAAHDREKLMKEIMGIAMRTTNSHDFVDQQGNPWMQASGAEKIARRFGLWIGKPTITKLDSTDEYYYFRVEGPIGFSQNECIHAIGNRSSKDPFFAKVKNEEGESEWKPVDDVDIVNIEMAAYSNWIVNGVTRFLGLRNMEWEELKQYGILPGKVTKVRYKTGSQYETWTQGQKDKAAIIGDYLYAKAGGNKVEAGKLLEMATQFTGRDKNLVPGKKNTKDLTGKRIDVLCDKLQKDKDFKEFVQAVKAQKEKPKEKPKEQPNGKQPPEGLGL